MTSTFNDDLERMDEDERTYRAFRHICDATGAFLAYTEGKGMVIGMYAEAKKVKLKGTRAQAAIKYHLQLQWLKEALERAEEINGNG